MVQFEVAGETVWSAVDRALDLAEDNASRPSLRHLALRWVCQHLSLLCPPLGWNSSGDLSQDLVERYLDINTPGAWRIRYQRAMRLAWSHVLA
ncbi:hypothetical protein IWX49DRAFT_590209 [Phyllosticta citricarpa]|uniref:Uncharacterized protein n=2 Tax=Phyllosticta TaxID=121621 RepID=A0ABR1LBN1_9PEZI